MKDQTVTPDAVHSSDLLAGLSLLTVIQINNRAEVLIRAARISDSGKYEAALLIPPYGRILVSTDANFESKEAAKAHMESVVKACVEYMAANIERSHGGKNL